METMDSSQLALIAMREALSNAELFSSALEAEGLQVSLDEGYLILGKLNVIELLGGWRRAGLYSGQLEHHLGRLSFLQYEGNEDDTQGVYLEEVSCSLRTFADAIGAQIDAFSLTEVLPTKAEEVAVSRE